MVKTGEVLWEFIDSMEQVKQSQTKPGVCWRKRGSGTKGAVPGLDLIYVCIWHSYIKSLGGLGLKDHHICHRQGLIVNNCLYYC